MQIPLCVSQSLLSHKLIYVFSAYELYAKPENGQRSASDVGDAGGQETSTMASRFKKAFSYEDVTVHFVGAWCVV